MAELITLSRFGAEKTNYHLYRIQGSAVDGKSHYHNYYQICYVLTGELLHLQGGKSVALRAGDAFIVPPGFIHSLHFNKTRTQVYSLAFRDVLFHSGFPQSNAYQFLVELNPDSVADRDVVRLRVVLDKDRRALMEGLLESLLQQQQTQCLPELSAAPSIIAAIIYLLAQVYYAQSHNAAELETVVGGNAMFECLEYINEHFRREITLTELTKRFGFSRSAFCSAFPQFSGMPLRRYIAHKRIQEAKMLIRSQPGWSLKRIGGEVGYDDDSTFYRNFLRVTGMSPKAYRELCE